MGPPTRTQTRTQSLPLALSLDCLLTTTMDVELRFSIVCVLHLAIGPPLLQRRARRPHRPQRVLVRIRIRHLEMCPSCVTVDGAVTHRLLRIDCYASGCCRDSSVGRGIKQKTFWHVRACRSPAKLDGKPSSVRGENRAGHKGHRGRTFVATKSPTFVATKSRTFVACQDVPTLQLPATGPGTGLGLERVITQ